MDMCRVCLSTEKDMVPLDESFIYNYNILTNLNISLLDGMPQYTCQTCLDTVRYFIEFREKSINSETTLKEIIHSNTKTDTDIQIEVKPVIEENYIKHYDIKTEIKEEGYDSPFENYEYAFEEIDKNITVNKDEKDVKPKRTKYKKKKCKLSAAKLLKNLTGMESRWLCGICPKTFADKSDLDNHLDIHKTDRNCELCREKVTSLSQLYAHRLIHLPKTQHRCHICNYKYRTPPYLESHYRKKHIEGENSKLACNQCPLKFDTPKKFNGHLLQVHSGIKYFCDVCSKGFTSKCSLKSHVKSHSEKKTYVCNLCEFSCKYIGGLKDHIIRKHNPKKVYCKNCKRPFSSQEKHDGHKCKEKVIVCPVCGLQLTGNYRLTQHMVKHSEVPLFECSRCPAKYKTKSALVAHVDRHDGNRTKQCEYCPAKFYTTSVLIKHRRTHTGERPYVCKICNKGFTGNHNLKVHMKVHGQYLVVKKNSDPEDLTTIIGSG